MYKKSIIYTSKFALIGILLILIITLSVILVITSCNKDETKVTPAPPGNEFLTTVILTCINSNTPYDTVIGIWRDLTPDDTIAPDISKAFLNLKTNSAYKVRIGILDETKIPPGDIGADVLARGNYHLLCFNISSSLGSNLTVARADFDTNSPPLPIGLKDNFTTINVSDGDLEVMLRHQPNAKDGSCNPGSTDFDGHFLIHIIN